MKYLILLLFTSCATTREPVTGTLINQPPRTLKGYKLRIDTGKDTVTWYGKEQRYIVGACYMLRILVIALILASCSPQRNGCGTEHYSHKFKS